MIQTSSSAIVFLLFILSGTSSAEDFASALARKANADFRRASNELEKEMENRRKEIYQKYLEDLKQARANALEKGNLEEAQRILKEEKSNNKNLPANNAIPKIVSIWTVVNPKGDKSLYVFRNDGKLMTAWNTCSWQLEENILTWQCTDSSAPNGAWKHRFKLSQDKKSFVGTNQIDTKFHGKLIFGSL